MPWKLWAADNKFTYLKIHSIYARVMNTEDFIKEKVCSSPFFAFNFLFYILVLFFIPCWILLLLVMRCIVYLHNAIRDLMQIYLKEVLKHRLFEILILSYFIIACIFHFLRDLITRSIYWSESTKHWQGVLIFLNNRIIIFFKLSSSFKC